MKVRIKYTKTGPLRFISHLDVMRYFQKAIRRAGFDIAYSKGFSPHQLISFAAPMPLLMTSVGEYFDAEFNSVTNSSEMIEKFNSVASPYLKIVDMVILPDNAKNSMSVVTASDYTVSLSEKGREKLTEDDLDSMVFAINSKSEIIVMKKTKKNEKMTDIKPSIYEIKKVDDAIYMMLSAGSTDNLKPELVLSAMCENIGISYSRYDYDILRNETYMQNENEQTVALIETGEKF